MCLVSKPVASRGRRFYVPIHECLTAKDHAKELGRVLCWCCSLSASPFPYHHYASPLKVCHTETAVRHSAFLAVRVILFPQFLVAQDLVRFAYLCVCEKRSRRSQKNVSR